MHLEIFNPTVFKFCRNKNCRFQIRLHSFKQLCYRKGEIQLFDLSTLIVHFTVVCLVAKPLNRSEAKVDLVMIQTSLLFK